MPDQKFAASLVKSVAEEAVRGIPIEGILVAGLQTIGLVTGTGPLIALATGVGSTLLNAFTHDAVDHWCSRWLGKETQEPLGGSGNSGTIAPVLSKAFTQAVTAVQDEWQGNQIYLRLKAHQAEEAARTVLVLKELLQTSNRFLSDIPAVAAAVESEGWAPLRTQNQAEAQQGVVDALGRYFLGYDEGFVIFVEGRLPDEWILRFGQLLKADTPEGNAAWRSCQQLWQESLEAGMAQLGQDTAEVRDTARWLKEWALRLESTPVAQRDPIGQEALDASLTRVQQRLDEIKAITERTLSNTEDIKVAIAQLSEQVREQTQVVIGPGAQVIQIIEEQAYKVSGLPNPYLGLRSFTYADRALYAGREQTVARGVGMLVSPGAQLTLLLITGASGSGKSSFAQAGLVPALEEFYAQRKMQAQHAVFRPSRQPLASLADALMQLGMPAGGLLTNPQATIGTPQLFAAFVKENTPPEQVNLLVIDQFEELFSQSDPSQRGAFLSILTALAAFGEIRTHILATMRSDYLPELFEMHELYDIAKQGIDLRVMTQGELKEAIQRPLQVARPQGDKRWEPALVDRLARDAAVDASYLPLLQVTLEEIWQEGSLTLDRYGTLADAIKGRAEAVYAYTTAAATRQAEAVYTYSNIGEQQLRTPSEQSAILAIFLDLVEVSLDDEARRDVRRSRSKSELVGGDAHLARLVDELTAARLLSTHAELRDERQVEMVDIIHETLIRNWDRLQAAITERRLDLQQRVRFEQALREWLANGRSDDYLLVGVRLAEAGALSSAGDVALRDPAARELLDRSRARQEAEQQRALEEQRQRAQEAVRRARVLRSLLVVTGLLLLAALGAATLAFVEQGQAQQESNARATAVVESQQQSNSRATAVVQAQLANEGLQAQLNVAGSQRLAFAAISQISAAPETAVLLAYEALSRDRNTASEQALRDAMGAVYWFPTVLKGHTGAVNGGVFSPDGSSIVTVSADKTARLWDRQGKQLAVLAGHTGTVESALFSPDGKAILTTSSDYTARLWDKEGKQLAVLSGHTDYLLGAVFSPDGKSILTCSYDGTARLWDLQGKQVTLLSGHTAAVNSAVFSSDGKSILTASSDGTARQWDTQGNQLSLLPASAATGAIFSATFSPDGASILTTSYDNTAHLWDRQFKPLAVLSGHTTHISSARFSPDGKSILTASYDYTARLWDLQGRQIALLSGHTGFVTGANFSPNGNYILTASYDKTARLWDLQGRQLAVLSGDTNRIGSAIFSPDGKSILTASDDGTARLWDTQGKQLAGMAAPQGNAMKTALFSPDGNYIVTTSNDLKARVWDIEGKHVSELSGHSSLVTGALFSPDGKSIVTASMDKTARVWDTKGKQLALLSGHNGYLNSAAFSPDGKSVVTSSDDGTARLWDTRGKQLALLSGHTGRVLSALFSPDGRRIITASQDGTSRQYAVEAPDLLLQAACMVGRGLTQEEVGGFGVGTPQFAFDKRQCPAVFSWEKK